MPEEWNTDMDKHWIIWEGKLGDIIDLRLPYQTKSDHWENKEVPTAGKGQHQNHLKSIWSIRKVFKRSCLLKLTFIY